MFHARTAFILGAGSSHEVGLPLGGTLAARISSLVDFKFKEGYKMISGDAGLYSAIRRRFSSTAHEYREAGTFIVSGIQLADSIDDFLSLHQSDDKITLVGKLGIVRAILGEEQNSILYPSGRRQSIDFTRLNDSWFVKLLKMASRAVPKEQVDNLFSNVAFVNFNYDRCLEFFLWRGLQQLYGIDARHATEVVSRLRIFHPYGSVGPLKVDSTESGIEFGATDVDWFEAATRIKTYSEKVDEGEDLASIREEIAKARLIIFLGIHFHEQNIELITPTTKMTAENIFGTALGFSDEDRSVVEDQLQVFLAKMYSEGVFLGSEDGPIRLRDLTCSQLFDRYSKTLPRPTALEPMTFPSSSTL